MQPEDQTLDEDLRIAVVMNGGVSLAIWIGGVSLELNRLTRRQPPAGDPYAALRALARCTARVDVIAGTSAGGINGGFLALATAYDRALDPLGDIWADDGGLLDLLRSPMAANPPSLLRGDEYFLPELRKAYDRIAPPHVVGADAAVPVTEAPVHLVMTTSLMNGTLRRFDDDFGTRIVEVEHKGRFTFRRGEDGEDAFTAPTITAELALASRSTASFPIAFEPSYIPVGAAGDDLHPDMAGPADFDVSRYVLDGGVLLNKPVRPALDAIATLPARREVRRVLAYVVPDPGSPVQPPPDDPGDMPTAARVLADTLVTLPGAQSITEELEEIREHNRKARERGVAGAELAPLLDEGVEDLARSAFEVYRIVRARRAVGHVADQVGPRTAPADPAGPAPWSYDELLVAFGLDGGSVRTPLPFVPRELDPDADPWDWGLAPAERIGWTVLDLLRRALAVAPLGSPVRPVLGAYREQVHGVLFSLRQWRSGDTAFWATRADALGTPPRERPERLRKLTAWAAESVALWPVADPAAPEQQRTAERDALGLITTRLIDLLVAASPLVLAAATATEPDRWLVDEAARVTKIVDGLGLGDVARAAAPDALAKQFELTGVDADTARGAAETAGTARGRKKRATTDAGATALRRLLALEVVDLALSGCPNEHLDPVDLVQVSGETPNGFNAAQTTKDKLAGVQLGHFGAFYKRSWRVNDWTWGRVDGATRIVQILLDPLRLRRLYDGRSGALLDELHAIATGGEHGAALEQMWADDLDDMTRELRYLDDDELEPPPALTAVAYAVARRVQADVLREELPRLADAVRVDERDGSGGRGPGADFAAAYEALAAADAPPADALLKLFARTHIASERITEEAGTDLFARTVSRAAAVAASTADSTHSGLGGARVVTKALRGITLTLYALVAGATWGSRVGAWFVNAALATGGALLAVALLAPNVAGPVKAVAAVLVLAALALSALRSRAWVLALVFGFPATVALALAFAPNGIEELRQHATVIGVTVGLVLALMVVGSVRVASRAPWPARVPSWWPARDGWYYAAAFAVSLGVSMAAFAWMEGSHSADIVRIEVFSPTRELAAETLEKWLTQAGGLARARSYLWRDFAYLATYWVPLTVAVAAVGRSLAAAARRGTEPDGPASRLVKAARLALTLSWLPLFAALLDAVENALLLGQVHEFELHGPGGFLAEGPKFLPALTTVVAGWKWLLVLACFLYVLAGGVAAGIAWFRRGS
jgi:patatin-related protein